MISSHSPRVLTAGADEVPLSRGHLAAAWCGPHPAGHPSVSDLQVSWPVPQWGTRHLQICVIYCFLKLLRYELLKYFSKFMKHLKKKIQFRY